MHTGNGGFVMNEKSSRRPGAALLLALLLFAVCLPQAFSQQRRRTPRRVTNPAPQTSAPATTPAPSQTGEPKLVSTADDEAAQDDTPRRTPSRGTRRTAAPEPTPDPLHSTVTRLSTQVEKLSDDLSQMKSDQRALFDLERLNRAEQRAEALRSQLRDVTDKEFMHQERLAQVEDELQPDSIQRRAALVGTLNPSSVRDQIQRSLERERDRTRKQLELVSNSRSRLEAAVVSAEAEVERLRQRIDAREQQQAGSGTGNEAANPAATTNAPTPTNTPTPAEPPE
jgi:hypothetical protein